MAARKKTNQTSQKRPIMLLLDLISKRWALRIMWELREGRLNFRELRERCDDVSPTSLNQRLKELREHDLVELDEDGYGYTRWGEELGEKLIEMHLWAGKWHKR